MVLVAVSVPPRALAALAFRPALLIPDSFGYMAEAVHGGLGQLRPGGYPVLLRLLEPAHSLPLITALQHVLGIGAAAIVYGMLSYWGLPRWAAALAAAPTLFDPRQIALESYILPDALYGFVVIAAVAILLTKRAPRMWQGVLAGLLIAYASLLRGNGLALIVPVLAYLLIRRVGWRVCAAATAASTFPVLAYVSLFYSDYGKFNITNSDGFFLWARTTSFANCALIKPSPDLVPLCPDKQPIHAPAQVRSWSLSAVRDARMPADYLWAVGAWWRHNAHPGINSANNALAMRFAIDAIKAQPLDYVRVVSRDVLLTLVGTDRAQGGNALQFTAKPDLAALPSYYAADLRAYAHTTGNTHTVQPYAYFLFVYQIPVYLPGVAFLAALIVGLAGVVRNRRRFGGPCALPFAAAALSIVLPAALAEDLYRYAIIAVPLAFLAAGLAFVRTAAKSPERARMDGVAAV